MQQEPNRLIACLAVCGLDSKLSSLSPPEQKWITSLKFIKEGKELLVSTEREKFVELVPGLLLKVGYNEVGKLPLNELQVIDQQIHDHAVTFNKQGWIPVSLEGDDRINKDTFRQKNINLKNFVQESKNPGKALVLCYQCEQSTESAICDISILKAEKGRGENDVFNVPHGYKIVNHTFTHKGRNKYIIYKRVPSKLEVSYVPTLLENYPVKPTDCKISLDLLPQFCFPEGVHLSEQMRGFIVFSFVLSSVTRTYCSCMIIKQPLQNYQKKKLSLKQDKIYSQKAICILSNYSYPQQYCTILQHLYRISLSKNDVPFYIVVEQLIKNLVMVREDEKGKVAITYPYGGCNVIFQTNIHFPIVSEKSIYCLFKFLSLPNIILFFEALLLQKQIFIVSQSKTVIGLIFEALQCILFPFEWEHVLIPILPESLHEYVDAIVPFIIGIPPSTANLDKQDCIFLDIDHNQFIGQQMPPLPDKLQKQLIKRLSVYEYYNQQHVQQYLQNQQNTYIFQMRTIDYPDFNPYDIRDAFFQFILTFMKNYNKFWNKTKKQALYKDKNEPLQELSEVFAVHNFLDDLNMSKLGSFGYKFSETTMFAHFIQRKCKQLQNPYFIFFDECLQKKRKKKQATCIMQTKPQKFRVTPPPAWNSIKQKTYQYQNLPSILKQQTQILNLNQVQIEFQTQSEQNQKHHLFSKLLQIHSLYKGVFQPVGEQIISKVQKLNLQAQIETLANQLLNNDNLDYLIRKISQMSQIKRVDKSNISLSDIKGMTLETKSKRDLKALQIIQYQLQSQIQQIYQFTKYFQLLPTKISNTEFIELTFPYIPKSKQQIKSKSQLNNLIITTLMKDTKSIKGCKYTITFDNRRSFLHSKNNINIIIHNTSIKQMLNNYIRKQPHKFYNFVIEKVNQEQIVWVFDKFMELREWSYN